MDKIYTFCSECRSNWGKYLEDKIILFFTTGLNFASENSCRALRGKNAPKT